MVASYNHPSTSHTNPTQPTIPTNRHGQADHGGSDHRYAGRLAGRRRLLGVRAPAPWTSGASAH